jgi:phosphoglycolate phosphatase
MMYKNILFDLDGTIVDSSEGIIASILYATAKMNWDRLSDEALRSFIGPPLIESFKKYTNSNEEAEQAVAYYREYYQAAGMYEVSVYKDIPQTLTKLKEAGAGLYIATSKPEYFAKQIIEHIQLNTFFSGIYGASMDNSRSQKGDVIRYGIKEAKLQIQQEPSVMVGDRQHDIRGAKENKLDSIGVLYGFGDQAELTAAGATHIVVAPQELCMLCL